MNHFYLSVALSLLFAVAIVSGCTDGGATAFRRMAFRKDDPSDAPEMVAETESIHQSAIDDINSSPIPASLVSTGGPSHSPQPTLITLPKGEDLNAKINAATGPVLLDFFADWCGPCRTQGKILHEVEGTAVKTHTLIIKINVDEHPQIAQSLRISSLPTLMMIKEGKIVERKSGLTKKKRLMSWMR